MRNQIGGAEDLLKIALVDDNTDFLLLLRKKVHTFFDGKNVLCEVRLFPNPEVFYFDLEEGFQYDICFLDIEMPQMNGLELARKIREAAQATYLIFITSYLQYAVEGYEVKAFSYIPKNLLEEKLEATLLGILGEMQKKVEKYYFVETNSRFERIEYQEIIYVYKNNKNAVFVLIDREVPVRKSLQEVYIQLDSSEFLCVERGYIVNIKHIVKLENKEITLRNGKRLQIGRTHMKEVKEAIHYFWRDRM